MQHKSCVAFVCLLALMELILRPNCSILYLPSSDVNSLKSLFMEIKMIIIIINIIIVL